MDDLDRMFYRLVQNVRTGYPDYLHLPFEVAELYQTLIPYRHNRRELGIETNQDYELALCRLLSGERGYLVVDDALAESMRRELATPNPNTAIFREFAASRVSFAPNAERRWEEMGVAGGAVSGAVGAAGAAGLDPTLATPPTPPSGPPAPAWLVRPGGTGSASVAPGPSLDRAEGGGVPRGAAPAVEGSCRYCGGRLPTDRRAMFCPHCGQNLMVQRCPACGTELEISWRFCITCGRGVATA